ncbi:hypothetical protein MATL_G00262670 [Megalops atlanticus]|uniref:CBM21 domain-containing protein n=1 Tax=Megalops atlanticus TaxID=7932 RepID=A0A9D3SU80_MEGAT|nr:hypothetical protein MATL_G00262670 [Megalops atlanticus]
MSTVTRLRLSSHGVSNVSVQRLRGRAELRQTDSSMEPAGQPRHAGSPGPLAATAEFAWEGWGCETEGRSSPLPQHGSSASSDESEPEPPAFKPRRVSFADAFGLDLVSVKEFDSQDATAAAAAGPLEGAAADSEEYFLSSLFAVPATAEELLGKLQEQKCELECIELLPGTTALRGIVRVLNLCYGKAVYVRTSLDSWSTHFDLLAEFVPGSSDGQTDRFMFKLTLVPPFEREGARVEFCIRYETAVGTFWANNKGMNYVLFCHQRGGRDSKEKQQEDSSYRNKKSCLKTISKDKSVEGNPTAISAETADLPNQDQEVAVRQVPESPAPYSDGLLHEDNRQKSLVENEQTVTSRRRRRAARLARVRDRFSQQKTEAQQGEEESGNSESVWLSPEISAPQLEGTTPHPLGMQDRWQADGGGEAAASDHTPPFLLRLDRGDTRFAAGANSAEEGGPPDVPLHSRQEEDTWRDSSHTFVNVGDTHSMVCTTAEEEIAPQTALWDSALAEPVIGQSDATEEPPLIAGETSDSEKGGDANGGGEEPKEEGHSFKEGENFCKENADYEGEGDTTSTDSLTDDEMELHMYSVKSAHMQELTQTPASVSRNTSMTVLKRPSIGRARILPVSLSSIRESLNEDGDGEEPSCPQEDIFHMEQPGNLTTIKLPPVEKVENVARSFLSTWGALLSFGHVSRAFLYALLCLVFFVTAYYYDFLACFALYLFSVYWLCFHGEKPRLQGTNRIE